jgi:hypothetical protein
MEKKIRIPTELYEKLEAIAKNRGVSVGDAVELLLIESYEFSKAQKEGQKFKDFMLLISKFAIILLFYWNFRRIQI